MIRRLPKKYRSKYARPKSVAVEIVFFACKVVGPVALFFIAAIGMDVYSFVH